MVICAESTVKQEENHLKSAFNYSQNDSIAHDLEVTQKLTDITDINRLIKKHASYFKTHFIKYNENKKDKILTEEITKIVMVLN